MRNKQQLILFFIFPIMALFYTMMEHEQSSYYLFMLMCSIMVPIMCVASTISEENERGTLRSLIYAGICSYEYFMGMGMCIGLLCFISICIVGMISGDSSSVGIVLVMMGVSIIISSLIGALIGTVTKSQVNVSAIAAPCSLVLGMLPVIGLMTKTVHNITQYAYSQIVLDVVMEKHITTQQIMLLVVNFLIFFVLFVVTYRKSALVNK